jgi:putative transposase
MSHPWRSKGEERTIAIEYQPSESILTCLNDMRDALRMALVYAYVMAKENNNRVPSPIALRRRLREWFYPRYDCARHHINPVCRNAVALLRSYKKRHKKLAVPEVKRLAMRIDAELFRIEQGKEGTVSARITLQPFKYEHITFTPRHKKWEEYSRGRASELLITDRRLYITFVTNEADGKKKPLGSRFVASDLNFNTIDSTVAIKQEGDGGDDGGTIKLDSVETEPVERIAQIQNDFSRRRRRIQLHVKNPKKRDKKLKETRGRQRNRIKDALQKLSTEQVRENPGASFIFERLTGIKENGNAKKSRKLRTYLNRWPYRMYQSMVEYKSPFKTVYVSPGGTSSRCPVCGGKVKHPAWAISRCEKCGADYDRDRLASLAILLRGMRLCGQPFAVSADASWQHMRDEYLYAPAVPDSWRAGWTEEAANAPNENVYTKVHV